VDRSITSTHAPNISQSKLDEIKKMDDERKKEIERRVKELQGESWGMDTRNDDVASNND